MDALPATLREALARRTVKTAAVGWPISLFPGPEGTALVPGLILAVDWTIEGPDLVVAPRDLQPSVNPAWIREVRRHSTWNEATLLERLLPEGEEGDLAAVGDRMRHALATLGGAALRPTEPAEVLTLSGTGLRNAVGFFLPEDGTFTKGAAEDLEALRSWPSEVLASTALGAILGENARSAGEEYPAIVSGTALTDSQIEAADAALRMPLTVIQGPPGTGKSQVILSLILTAVVSGKTVLFAAKNHQAVDEVERRLKELVPDSPLLTRARDADGERDTSFLDALTELAHSDVQRQRGEPHEEERQKIISKARDLKRDRAHTRELNELHLALSDATERLNFFSQANAEISPARKRPPLSRFLSFLRTRLYRASEPLTTPLPERASIADVEHRVEMLRQQLARLPHRPVLAVEVLETELQSLATRLRSFLPRLAASVTSPSDAEWRQLSERERELKFQKVRSSRKLTMDDARAVARLRPVWAVSTLSAPARIPLHAGLFDYVIFDEASQCDIASALPLMARARQAVVVGDPMQLRFIPPLSTAAEHALMDGIGIPQAGRASIAQSCNSLFDFSERRPIAVRKFLADQFRSAPAIVAYLNEDFYGGRLIGRRPEESFRAPGDYRAGLAWDDVTGHAARSDGGLVNLAEAERIAALLKQFAQDHDFVGSVGVISPFNAQVAKLQQVIDTKLSKPEQEKLSLRVATVDRFQGGEADVVLFSLVLAASAPQSAWTFLQKERRRLNVAVSRARALCIVVGDLAYARSSRIRHIEFLANRATTPWSPPRPQQHDSLWERRLDTAMRGRGWAPIPQHPVGTRYLDFALDPSGAKLAIEVDGRKWHTDESGNRKIGDRLRDAELQARGWRVLRFWVHELADNMEACLDRIEHALRGR
jgi:very-short-patch-repair endonuclease